MIREALSVEVVEEEAQLLGVVVLRAGVRGVLVFGRDNLTLLERESACTLVCGGIGGGVYAIGDEVVAISKSKLEVADLVGIAGSRLMGVSGLVSSLFLLLLASGRVCDVSLGGTGGGASGGMLGRGIVGAGFGEFRESKSGVPGLLFAIASAVPSRFMTSGVLGLRGVSGRLASSVK